MAFAKSTQARHPLAPPRREVFTTLQTSLHAADRPVARPRFDPGLSTGPGGFTTGDLGVSPDRTFTGWLTRACARLRHDHSFVLITSELLDARGSRLNEYEPCPSSTRVRAGSPAAAGGRLVPPSTPSRFERAQVDVGAGNSKTAPPARGQDSRWSRWTRCSALTFRL